MKNQNILYCLAILFFLISSMVSAQPLNKVVEKGNLVYLDKTIVIKLKENPSRGPNKSINLTSALAKKLAPFRVKSAKSFLPVQTKSESSLNRIITLEYENDIDPMVLAAKLKNIDEIEWAEPRFLRSINFTPNDPLIGNQYNLTKINAFQAWDISKGDSSIIIAIIDSGVDWDHPDLASKIWINKNEIPGNGIDDDNNGYVDDIRGWDFGGIDGTPDNDPMEDRPDHGTFVAGVSAASTDNGTGIAAIGFNSKIMPVKTSQDNFRNIFNLPYIVYGYEGIVYAADNGARVINCSFGGAGFSILEQEVINYAISKNALVVAAAGNDNLPDSFYPASYAGVLSVASTNQGDMKSSFSNYGSTVDVSAPGSGIYSTWQNDTYRYGDGTSFSSPLTAGLAALVAAHFPLYSPEQVAEQIRVNTDNINSLNPNYINQLGSGRINAFKALSNTNSISVRAVEYEFSDEAPGGNGNGILQSGETISLGVKFINYLNPTSNLTITLESHNSNAVVQNGTFTVGSAATLDSFDNYSAKFTIGLSSNTPQNARLLFTLNFNDGNYVDFQTIETTANPTYSTQSGGDVALTITSKGALAFNDYSTNINGKGFRYLDGGNLLFEGALILGTSPSNISDAARGADQSTQNKDFTVVEPFVLNVPGSVADQQGSTVFNDDGAQNSKLGVSVKLNSYTFSVEPHRNYIILQYEITNTGSSAIDNLYAGIFLDWDLIDGSGLDDFTAFDDEGKLAYVYNTSGTPNTYTGSALISSDNYGFYAILNPGGDGGFQIYDGFNDSEKWQAISGGISKQQAGSGDISHVISGGPFNIPAGESVKVAFAIAAAPDLNGIRNAISNARNKYQSLITSVDNNEEIPFEYSLSQNYPNPFNPKTTISYSLAESGSVSLKIFDILGNEIASLVNEEQNAGKYEVEFDSNNLTAGKHGLSSGIYFYTLTAGNYIQTKKLILLK